MKIDAVLTQHVKVDVAPDEVIKELCNYYFHHEFNDMVEQEDGLYYEYDVSMHGSPVYQYELITKDENLIEIFRGLNKIYYAQITLETKKFSKKKNK